MRLLLLRLTLASLLLSVGTPAPVGAAQLEKSGNTISGNMYGKEFKPDNVELENGQLTIRQGDSFAPGMRLSISLFDIGKGEIPEGKSYSVNPGSQKGQNLQVNADWQEEGENHTYKMIRDGYRLQLSFGREEKKGLLPGRVEFSIPGSSKTEIKGSFVAKLTGFRIINGKVDLTSDAHATLDEVAVEYLRKKYPGREVGITDKRENVMVASDSVRKWGYKDLAITIDGTSAGRTKLLFTKQSGEWAVFSELTPQQFPHAHPVYPPQDYEELVTIISAQKAERDFLTSFPDKEVQDVHVMCVYYDPDGFAGAEVKYKVEGSAEEQERHYILQLKEGHWELIGEVHGQAMIPQEIAKVRMQMVLGQGCDSCRVKGVLRYDGKDITTVTSVEPVFWFRDERNNIEVVPKLEYEKGRLTISGLPPGDYGMSVDIDANQENEITYPGDYQTFIRFQVVEGESTLPDVNLAKVIHLTAPQDNGRLMEHFGQECSGNISFPSPVRLAWEPLEGGTSYDYEITRVDCKSYDPLATAAKGTTTESSLSVQLPESAPGEFYMFMINARKNDTFTGLLTTRGVNGYGWDYRFRVR